MFGLLNKREFGGQLETFARKQLKKAGCKIVETNFSCKLGEIDIIVRDQQTLVFVEVRYRKNANFGGASASVDRKKQSKLINTANFYLQKHNLGNKEKCRFDVVALQGSPERLEFRWIKNAFGE
ncbi:MAG: YraN family protein [Kangiellaceae bacterium]|nr:YraN family protein [Kangiellaceae bacterium]MCW8997921.1 YraN family protein [Kangiellaceae bacterium]MCW9017568.1 YraN family protein [Kangiellaceae bacterium]